MSLLVVGCSHRTAPVSVLERVALAPADAAKLAQDVAGCEHVTEAVVLSTCNRVEVYAEVEKFHATVVETTEMLARHTGVPVEELSAHLYVHYEDRAVRHVFAVACGLDSMLVGEQQVLAQVRAALRAGQAGGTAGRTLNELLQQALRVGKRAHAETGIDRAAPSLVSVGLEIASGALGSLEGRRALVVGAGAMSSLAATTLQRAGVGELVVANRTYASGDRLATALGGRAVGFETLADALGDADLVVSCTGAVGTVIDADAVIRARGSRGAAPQVFLDLALPRDVDAAVAELEGVTLVDLDRLASFLEGDERTADVEAVRRIVAEEVSAFLGWQRAAAVAPTVVALREMASEVVTSELTRLAGRLPQLDDRARDEVAQTVRRVVDKLLHAPTVRVKQLAESPDGVTYATALRELFDLDLAAVEAVSTLDPEGQA
jgi:glutamyl-tRNA reductase